MVGVRVGVGMGGWGSLSTAPSRFESFLLSFINFRVGVTLWLAARWKKIGRWTVLAGNDSRNK